MISRIEMFSNKRPRVIVQIGDNEIEISQKTLMDNETIKAKASAFVNDSVNIKQELDKKIKAVVGKKAMPPKSELKKLGLTIEAQRNREETIVAATIAKQETESLCNKITQLIEGDKWLLN